MDDRELLEMAAKAAGYVVRWYDDTLAYGPTFGIEVEPGNPCGFDPWNPLTDDGDALRLATKLRIGLHWCSTGRVYAYADGDVEEFESTMEEPDSSVRRAIVRAAAEIGRAM